MKQNEIEVGKTYRAKVSGLLCNVKVTAIEKREGNHYRKGGIAYTVTNLRSGRELVFKSAMKFRSLVEA